MISYKHKPRLRTALEMLHAAQKIEKNLEKVQQRHLVFTVKYSDISTGFMLIFITVFFFLGIIAIVDPSWEG